MPPSKRLEEMSDAEYAAYARGEMAAEAPKSEPKPESKPESKSTEKPKSQAEEMGVEHHQKLADFLKKYPAK